MILLRNLLIVAVLALGLTVLPGGGNLAAALLTALSLVFLTAIALVGQRFWRESAMTRDTMTDRQRGILYAALGALALMVVGMDELFATGAGTVAWIAVVGASVWGIVSVWRAASSY